MVFISWCLPFLHGSLRRLRRLRCSSPLLETHGSDWIPNGNAELYNYIPLSLHCLWSNWKTLTAELQKKVQRGTTQKYEGEDPASVQFQNGIALLQKVFVKQFNQKNVRLLLEVKWGSCVSHCSATAGRGDLGPWGGGRRGGRGGGTVARKVPPIKTGDSSGRKQI